jgi:hypothetical protein
LVLINEVHPTLVSSDLATREALLIAETYALLMRDERIEGRLGQPPWLPDEIYQLMSRIGI